MNLHFEKFLPLYGALAAGAVWCVVKPSLPQDEKEFLAAAISLGAVLTGFIATAKAILAALPSESVARSLRSSDYWGRLVAYLRQALSSCLGFSVISLAGFFLLTRNEIALPRWYGVVWCVVGVYALLAFHRVSSILFTIISDPPKKAADE